MHRTGGHRCWFCSLGITCAFFTTGPYQSSKTSGLMAERLALTEWFVSVFARRVIVMLISRMKCSNDNDKNQTK